MAESASDQVLLRLSADIVAAHVAHNTVAAESLPELIRTVHAALRQLGTTDEAAPAQEPAVSIKRSVFPSYIICLEDGKKLKMLKRHLQTSYGMTPDDYRAKWGLPSSYPMVAPEYAAHRSTLAHRIGLGRKPDAAAAVPVKQIPAGKRGPKPKVKAEPAAEEEAV